jgi:hypothetical protein
MTPHDPAFPDVPAISDEALLAEVRMLYEGADPIPDDLVERVQFAISLEDLDLEVLRLTEGEPDLVGARGDEEARTITFDCDSLTIMIRLAVTDAGAVRVDGWLAPPAAHRVEMRTVADRLVTDADGDGRFVFDGVPRGLAQLVVRSGADGGPGTGRSVVTPSIVV